MLSKYTLRRLFEERKPRGFVQSIHRLLGLVDDQGRKNRDQFGRPVRKDAQIRPEEVRTTALAEAIFGEELEHAFSGDALSRFSRFSALAESQGTPLLEAGGVDVTQFLNINAYNAVVGGLIEFKVLEGFEMPGYEISEKLFPSIPTKLNGRRTGRIGSIGDKAARRLPGMPTQRVGLQEEWVDVPETEEYALSIEVNQEAVFFDITNDILAKAQTIGEAVKYRKELRCIDVLAGITNPYEYKDTAYNTFLNTDPPAAGEWYNDQVKTLTDWTSINDALQLFARMTDPASGKRVVIMPNTLVTVPSLRATANYIQNATHVETTTNSTEVRRGPTPLDQTFAVITSPLLHMRLTDSDGSNLSEANSKRWWLLAPGFGAYDENWPLRVDAANPSTMDMMDRGVMAFYKASERGIPWVTEPRKAVRNKVA
ncbi:MAG TPA: hypothetical protein VEA41_01100 [Salinarimonas sp.]|nr:hypothetical protein [Salinarimonas sp.]